MGRVKGSAVTSRVRYVREHADESVWAGIKAELSPASRGYLDVGVLPHAWVPYSLFLELNIVADAHLGRGDLELCREMGRFGAKVNLPTIYRIFLRFGSVPFILNKAARLWNVHYDSGEMEVQELTAQHARLVIRDFDEPHRAHCLSVLGWAEGAAALTGAEIIDAREETCRASGADACRLSIRWQG